MLMALLELANHFSSHQWTSTCQPTIFSWSCGLVCVAGPLTLVLVSPIQSTFKCCSNQTRWKDVKLLILDEKSMVGHRQMGRLDRRLRQAFPHAKDEILGRVPTVIFGDFAQLPPVGDSAVFSTKAITQTSDLSSEGRRVYESFTSKDMNNSTYNTWGDIHLAEGEGRICPPRWRGVDNSGQIKLERFFRENSLAWADRQHDLHHFVVPIVATKGERWEDIHINPQQIETCSLSCDISVTSPTLIQSRPKEYLTTAVTSDVGCFHIIIPQGLSWQLHYNVPLTYIPQAPL